MTKKILAVLLAAFLLAQPVLAAPIFNDGTLDWGCIHAYDNACDATCNKCNAERQVPAHPYAAVTTPATCTKEGITTYTCTVCGDCYTETIPTIAHTFSHLLEEKGPSCDQDGYIRYGCTQCDATTTEVIPAYGHSYPTACPDACSTCGAIRIPPHQYADPYDADCDLCGATREVNPLQVGDVNGDGKVNVRDQGLLQQHLNGWEVTISLAAADVNGDGKVNVRDQGLLQQYLNGWDVKLG